MKMVYDASPWSPPMFYYILRVKLLYCWYQTLESGVWHIDYFYSSGQPEMRIGVLRWRRADIELEEETG